MIKGKDYGGRTYGAIHTWQLRNFGKATKCENPNCTTVGCKTFDWALIKGKTYDKVKENFMQLCRGCHVKYDKKRFIVTEYTRKKISKKLKHYFRTTGMSEETKRKMAIAQQTRRKLEKL